VKCSFSLLGNVNNVIDTLLTVCGDEEALDQIRTYSKEQRKKLEDEMEKETKKNLLERTMRLQNEKKELEEEKRLGLFYFCIFF